MRSQAEAAKGQIKVIVTYNYIMNGNSIKRNEFANRVAAQVHVRLWLGEQQAGLIQATFRQQRIKALAREGELMLVGVPVEE